MVRHVTHINVRLSEGGAAGVARSLCDGLRERGVATSFVYGYGKGGGSSPLEKKYNGIRLTPKAIAIANRSVFPILGDELGTHSRKAWRSLRECIQETDVVHLHAAHSYMANSTALTDLLIESGKPVVWTMHDQWHFTGRCAQPEGCVEYLGGCVSCPDMTAYPPALIDRAKTHWPRRRSLTDRLQETGRFALVACANWLAEAGREAGLPVALAIQNSVDREFWDSVTHSSRTWDQPRKRVLFICRDLRDKKKVHLPTLREIAKSEGLELTIVGDNAPEHIDGARMIPSIVDRSKLAETMRAHDVLVFASRVDYFPLTIVEALVAGMTVVAIDSPAAREFVDSPRMQVVNDYEQLAGAISSAQSQVAGGSETRFSPDSMVDSYMRIYERLMKSGN